MSQTRCKTCLSIFQEKTDDKNETETIKERKSSFLDNLKFIKGHVQLPSFLRKKESKVKDIEAGMDNEEESKELLETTEGKNVDSITYVA